MSDETEHGRPRIRAADHVGFAVKSLDDPLQFWIEGLGAELIGVSGGDGMFLNAVKGTPSESARIGLVSLVGQKVELLEYRGGSRPHHHPAAPYGTGAAHVALTVDDLDRLLAPVRSHGWQTRGTPQPLQAGPSAGTRGIYVSGPDAASIEFMEPPT